MHSERFHDLKPADYRHLLAISKPRRTAPARFLPPSIRSAAVRRSLGHAVPRRRSLVSRTSEYSGVCGVRLKQACTVTLLACIMALQAYIIEVEAYIMPVQAYIVPLQAYIIAS